MQRRKGAAQSGGMKQRRQDAAKSGTDGADAKFFDMGHGKDLQIMDLVLYFTCFPSICKSWNQKGQPSKAALLHLFFE